MEHITKTGVFVRHTINKPFLWSLVLPVLLMDLFAIVYIQIGFRLCRIPLIKRSNYVRIDRQKLSYLTPYQKLQCVYCGYANGVLQYGVEVGVRLERYWCGIQHRASEEFVAPPHHEEFVPYGDEEAFRAKFKRPEGE